MGKLVCAFFSTKRSFPWLCFHPVHDFTLAVPNTPSSARPARGPRGPAPGLRPPAGVTGPSDAAPVSPPERGETGPGLPRPGRSRLLRFTLVSKRALPGAAGPEPTERLPPPPLREGRSGGCGLRTQRGRPAPFLSGLERSQEARVQPQLSRVGLCWRRTAATGTKIKNKGTALRKRGAKSTAMGRGLNSAVQKD